MSASNTVKAKKPSPLMSPSCILPSNGRQEQQEQDQDDVVRRLLIVSTTTIV